MDLASYFDHTNLNPTASRSDIKRLVDEALNYGFYSVCVHPFYVSYVRELLGDSPVKLATVVGFPQGQNTPEVKVFEAKDAIENGADEIDMVMNFGALKDFRDREVLEEVRGVKKACGDKLLKVILETSQLSVEEIVRACGICQRAGADYVKTSTGFLGEGASVEKVALMARSFTGLVKASGGVRDLAGARAMIDAGASRLGSSSSVKIMQELVNEGL